MAGYTARVATSTVQAALTRAASALERGRGAEAVQILLPHHRSGALPRDEELSVRARIAEAYLLQAFLCHNRAYEVVLALNLLMRDYPAAVQAAWPHYDPGVHQGISHSFWIRRIC